jgi:hypothetical protein
VLANLPLSVIAFMLCTDSDQVACADFVRRRRWLLAPEIQVSTRSGSKFICAGDTRLLSSAAVEAEKEAKKSNYSGSARTAGVAFMAMLQEAVGRKGGLLAIPWDPVSWTSVYTAHANWLATTQRLLLPGRLRKYAGYTRQMEDLQAAVDFSRAAYGYAFLHGGLSSVYRYVHMQTVQRSTFDVIGGVSPEANNLSACALAGVQVTDICMAEWESMTYRYVAGAGGGLLHRYQHTTSYFLIVCQRTKFERRSSRAGTSPVDSTVLPAGRPVCSRAIAFLCAGLQKPWYDSTNSSSAQLTNVVQITDSACNMSPGKREVALPLAGHATFLRTTGRASA